MNAKKIVTVGLFVLAFGGIIANAAVGTVKTNDLQNQINVLDEERKAAESVIAEQAAKAVAEAKKAIDDAYKAADQMIAQAVTEATASLSEADEALAALIALSHTATETAITELGEETETAIATVNAALNDLAVTSAAAVAQEKLERETDIEDINAKIAEATTAIAALQTSVETLSNGLKTTQEDVSKLTKDFNDHVAAINQSVAKVEARVGALETGLDALKTRVDALEQKVKDLETAVADHKQKIEALETISQTHSKDLKKLNDEVAAINDEITAIQADVAALRSEITATWDKFNSDTVIATKQDLVDQLRKQYEEVAETIYDDKGTFVPLWNIEDHTGTGTDAVVSTTPFWYEWQRNDDLDFEKLINTAQDFGSGMGTTAVGYKGYREKFFEWTVPDGFVPHHVDAINDGELDLYLADNVIASHDDTRDTAFASDTFEELVVNHWYTGVSTQIDDSKNDFSRVNIPSGINNPVIFHQFGGSANDSKFGRMAMDDDLTFVKTQWQKLVDAYEAQTKSELAYGEVAIILARDIEAATAAEEKYEKAMSNFQYAIGFLSSQGDAIIEARRLAAENKGFTRPMVDDVVTALKAVQLDFTKLKTQTDEGSVDECENYIVRANALVEQIMTVARDYVDKVSRPLLDSTSPYGAQDGSPMLQLKAALAVGNAFPYGNDHGPRDWNTYSLTDTTNFIVELEYRTAWKNGTNKYTVNISDTEKKEVTFGGVVDVINALAGYNTDIKNASNTAVVATYNEETGKFDITGTAAELVEGNATYLDNVTRNVDSLARAYETAWTYTDGTFGDTEATTDATKGSYVYGINQMSRLTDGQKAYFVNQMHLTITYYQFVTVSDFDTMTQSDIDVLVNVTMKDKIKELYAYAGAENSMTLRKEETINEITALQTSYPTVFSVDEATAFINYVELVFNDDASIMTNAPALKAKVVDPKSTSTDPVDLTTAIASNRRENWIDVSTKILADVHKYVDAKKAGMDVLSSIETESATELASLKLMYGEDAYDAVIDTDCPVKLPGSESTVTFQEYIDGAKATAVETMKLPVIPAGDFTKDTYASFVADVPSVSKVTGAYQTWANTIGKTTTGSFYEAFTKALAAKKAELHPVA